MGDANGALGSLPARYTLAILSNRSLDTEGSASAFVVMDSPMDSISVHGEMQTPAAGMGSPTPLKATSAATVRPPPAESPAITIFSALVP